MIDPEEAERQRMRELGAKKVYVNSGKRSASLHENHGIYLRHRDVFNPPWYCITLPIVFFISLLN